MPNAQIFGGAKDGEWHSAPTNVLVLVERVGDSNQIVTYTFAPGHKWIEVNRRKLGEMD